MKSPHSYDWMWLPSEVLLEVHSTYRWGRKSSRWQSARAAKLSGKEGNTTCGSCISGYSGSTLMTSTCSDCPEFGQQSSYSKNCHPAASLAAGMVSLLATLASAAQGSHPARRFLKLCSRPSYFWSLRILELCYLERNVVGQAQSVMKCRGAEAIATLHWV